MLLFLAFKFDEQKTLVTGNDNHSSSDILLGDILIVCAQVCSHDMICLGIFFRNNFERFSFTFNGSFLTDKLKCLFIKRFSFLKGVLHFFKAFLIQKSYFNF
jgi:hypothetical protein